ncbi:MAG: hypothetical protein LBB59_04065 [Campylobacteraceae bacterium]|nr:hypothetical protein [Campylobacteraceae bacterium]
MNDPVNGVDPSGEFMISPHVIAIAGVVIMGSYAIYKLYNWYINKQRMDIVEKSIENLPKIDNSSMENRLNSYMDYLEDFQGVRKDNIERVRVIAKDMCPPPVVSNPVTEIIYDISK